MQIRFQNSLAETKRIVIANHEATISTLWSKHFGYDTTNYSFNWGVARENKEFTDNGPGTGS